jgi:hypothetical protein
VGERTVKCATHGWVRRDRKERGAGGLEETRVFALPQSAPLWRCCRVECGLRGTKVGRKFTLVQGGVELGLCGILYRTQKCVQELGCVPPEGVNAGTLWSAHNTAVSSKEGLGSVQEGTEEGGNNWEAGFYDPGAPSPLMTTSLSSQDYFPLLS